MAESGDGDEPATIGENGGSGEAGVAGVAGVAGLAGLAEMPGAVRGGDAPFPLLDGFPSPFPLAAGPPDAGVNGRAGAAGRDRPVESGRISGGGPLELSCRETRH